MHPIIIPRNMSGSTEKRNWQIASENRWRKQLLLLNQLLPAGYIVTSFNHFVLGLPYYNNLREHSSLGYKTPYEHLKEQLPDIDDNIKFVIPVLLDKVSADIGPWSGYHVLAQHQFGLGLR